MEKKVEISMLLQIYGKLLTKKQQDVMNLYYDDDLSLSEIAEIYKISRQGVSDIIKKGETNLLQYEKVLHIMKTTETNTKTIDTIIFELSKIDDNTSKSDIQKILNNVQKKLHSIQ